MPLDGGTDEILEHGDRRAPTVALLDEPAGGVRERLAQRRFLQQPDRRRCERERVVGDERMALVAQREPPQGER